MEVSFKIREESTSKPTESGDIELELKNILSKVHSHPAKRELDTTSTGRIRIACPFCGDSQKSPAKKRGIVYLVTGTYKCWNGGCNTWKPLKDFFEHFGSDISINIKDFDLDSYISGNKTENISFSIFDVYNIKDKLIDRHVLMEKMGLVDIVRNVEAYKYLRSRKMDCEDQRLAVNPRSNDIIFFNMTQSGKVLGIQIRKNKPLEGRPRFISFSYGDILEKILKSENINTEEAEKVKRISLIYNILRVDLKKPLNVFESSINSHHFQNAIASWGTGSTLRLKDANYFMDSDVAGRKKAVELLKEGHNVFMWTLFKKINRVFEKDDDINDLFKRGLKDNKPLFDFLTNKKLDIVNL